MVLESCQAAVSTGESEGWSNGEVANQRNEMTVDTRKDSGGRSDQGHTVIHTSGGNVQINIQPPAIQNNLNITRNLTIPNPPASGINTESGESNKFSFCKQSDTDVIEKTLRERIYEPELNLPGLNLNRGQVPIVHPKIYKFSFFKDVDSDLENEPMEKIKEIDFSRFIEETKKERFIAMLGFPGSGKTTCSQRLVKQVKAAELIWFHLTFLDMNFKKEKVTLKDLLLSTLSSDFSPDVYDDVFGWIVANQERVVIIIDGFDQADWTLPLNCPRKRLDVPQQIQKILYSLIHGHFLPHARLIFTSRPHALQSLPRHLRPGATYMIGDLSPYDMRTLFYGLCGPKAEEAWQLLETNTPQLMSVCLCPLILQLYIKVVISSSTQTSEVTTTTRIFNAVLKRLRYSENIRNSDINRIFSQLAKLSYTASSCGTETIGLQDLRRINLDIKTVQDLVVPLRDDGGETYRLVEGKKNLYFCHQTFQEYFTAWYIAYQMSIKKFKKLAKIIFQEDWTVTRQFLFGILFDVGFRADREQSLNEEESVKLPNLRSVLSKRNEVQQIKKKKSILKKALIKVAGKQQTDHGLGLVALSLDARESNSDDLLKEVANHFFHISLLDEPSFPPSTAHALSLVVRRVEREITELSLCGCNIDSDALSYICEAIKEMPGKVCKMDVSENKLSDVTQLCSILHKISDVLVMEYCLVTEEGASRCANAEEKERLMRSLEHSGNTNLKVVLRACPHEELSHSASSDRRFNAIQNEKDA